MGWWNGTQLDTKAWLTETAKKWTAQADKQKDDNLLATTLDKDHPDAIWVLGEAGFRCIAESNSRYKESNKLRLWWRGGKDEYQRTPTTTQTNTPWPTSTWVNRSLISAPGCCSLYVGVVEGVRVWDKAFKTLMGKWVGEYEGWKNRPQVRCEGTKDTTMVMVESGRWEKWLEGWGLMKVCEHAGRDMWWARGKVRVQVDT